MPTASELTLSLKLLCSKQFRESFQTPVIMIQRDAAGRSQVIKAQPPAARGQLCKVL